MNHINKMQAALSVDFAPLLSWGLLFTMLAAIAVLLALSFRFHRRGLLMRGLCAAAFMLLFFNLSVTEELRGPVSDVVIVAADHSPSQQIGKRAQRTDAALAYLKEKLAKIPGLDVRTVDSNNGESGPARETHIFDKIDRVLADVPVTRRGGVIVVSDGQIHDVPQDPRRFDEYGPVHILLSGEKKERDRQLIILEAPSYGIVGQTVTVKYRIADTTAHKDDTATLLARQDGVSPQVTDVPVNTDQTLTVTVNHAGQNIIDLEASPAADEITQANNRVPLIVNGVRDRLKVLLVSGQPYAGGRTWRNILTSDPGVDLVHFTILRQPDKIDNTPQDDLSLIAFPFEELFQVKLYDFDLIIFDRYRLNRILPDYYFANIAKYVRDGGALLVTDGPPDTNEESIHKTALGQILPAQPNGSVIEKSFKPAITDTGRHHPVTQGLTWPGATETDPGWGSWLRQVAVQPTSGETLMSGADKTPLLILDHVGKGRVAELASDQIWLWSRGYEGGGPQAELLRRLGHWLMKEPELEENSLNVSTEGGSLLIKRRSLKDDAIAATVTAPDGTKSTVDLKASADGVLEGRAPAPQLGVYTVNDGTQERFALVGAINPPELTGVRTTAEKMAPLVKASKGATIWLADEAHPDIRSLGLNRGTYGSDNWLALRRNGAYTVTGTKNNSLLPEWFYAIALIALIIGAWWREGRTTRRLPKTE